MYFLAVPREAFDGIKRTSSAQNIRAGRRSRSNSIVNNKEEKDRPNTVSKVTMNFSITKKSGKIKEKFWNFIRIFMIF